MLPAIYTVAYFHAHESMLSQGKQNLVVLHKLLVKLELEHTTLSSVDTSLILRRHLNQRD